MIFVVYVPAGLLSNFEVSDAGMLYLIFKDLSITGFAPLISCCAVADKVTVCIPV